jgi:hypothetical protein
LDFPRTADFNDADGEYAGGSASYSRMYFHRTSSAPVRQARQVLAVDRGRNLESRRAHPLGVRRTITEPYEPANAPASFVDEAVAGRAVTRSAKQKATTMNRQWIFAGLGAAIGLSAASAALAGSDRYYGPQGYQVQTWQDIEQDRLDIQRQIQKEYHLDNAGNAHIAVPPKHLRRASHQQTRD